MSKVLQMVLSSHFECFARTLFMQIMPIIQIMQIMSIMQAS